LKGVLTSNQPNASIKLEEHPFFGMRKSNKGDVQGIMDQLRGQRYHNI
jgi:hypothetical protein